MTKNEISGKWLGKLTHLNAATGRGACRGKAPHKPLLLLCLLDLAETGELPGRSFTRTAGLVLRFKSYGALVSDRWPTRLDLRMPFFYLRNQGFWQAFTMEMHLAQSPDSCFVCELHEEFFDLLGDTDFRLKARLLIVSRYFEGSERVALLESLGLCSDTKKRSEIPASLSRIEAERVGLQLNEEAEDIARKKRPRRPIFSASGVPLQVHLRADRPLLCDSRRGRDCGRCAHCGVGGIPKRRDRKRTGAV